jgi:2-(1,2-epoxy-1,2-dihydrophenyl)acetyl-CoA isomerase
MLRRTDTVPDYDTLSIEREGRVARLAFDRPEKLNTFNARMRQEFVLAARELNADDDVWVVLLSGNGRAFGAGADLSENEGTMGGGEAVEDQLNFEFKPGVLAIRHARKPWVAAIHGACAGISYSYAMACDLVVMAEGSFLYQPFAAIGLVPDGGATWLLPQLVGSKRAYELMAFGEKLPAEKAVDWGLANCVLPADDFAAAAMNYAQTLAAKSPLAMRYTKEAIAYAETHTLAESISQEAALQRLCIDSDDAKGAVRAFLEKRAPVWRGR